MKKEVNFRSKAQFSMEYLLMMGFTLMLLIPTIILFASESNNIKSDMGLSQITQITIKLSEKAEEMYYQGSPSRTTVKASFPEHIENITISGKDIVFYYRNSDNTLQTIVQTCQINVTGNLSVSKGIHFILIKSEGDYVSIEEN